MLLGLKSPFVPKFSALSPAEGAENFEISPFSEKNWEVCGAEGAAAKFGPKMP